MLVINFHGLNFDVCEDFPSLMFLETLFEVGSHADIALTLRSETLDKINVIHWPLLR